MKKRWIDVMLAVAVCLGLSGCSSGETSSMPDLAQGPYTNGSYEVKMPQYEGGWQEYGKITVSDGYITAVEYDARNEAGEKRVKIQRIGIAWRRGMRQTAFLLFIRKKYTMIW